MRTGVGELLLVATGGGIGAVLRFMMGGAVHAAWPVAFPFGTLAVNTIGCFLIGALGGWFELRPALAPEWRLFLFAGLLGGFTTYSSFAFETLALAREAAWLRAGANVLLQTLLGLGAAAAGFVLVRGSGAA